MGPLPVTPILVGSSAMLLVGLGLWLRSRRKTPEERERQRRQWVNRIGRITDGTVLDVCEVQPEGKKGKKDSAAAPMQLLIFNYDVAGVTYEASQDVTHLRQYFDVHSCRLGVPASIKYDPQNPGNSIVIAEGWIGLRN
jgi:hypothetical protein